jgi:hypothetical protein
MNRFLTALLFTAFVMGCSTIEKTNVDSKPVKKYDLNWKINSTEIIAYKYLTEPLTNDENTVKDFADNFFSTFETDFEIQTGIDSLVSKVSKAMDDFKNDPKIVLMEQRDENSINVTWLSGNFSDNEKSSQDSTAKKNLFSAFLKGVMLRGVVNKSGDIASFYNVYNHKNLLSTMFELPTNKVAIGDKWELNINLTAFDQNFVCSESSKTNEVELVEVYEKDGKQIAVLKYNIFEKAVGEYSMPFGKKKKVPSISESGAFGKAELNITDGQWLSYSVILMIKMTGFQNISTSEKHSLIRLTEIPEKALEMYRE